MAEHFNIDRFMDASGRVDLSDIDWSEVPEAPHYPGGDPPPAVFPSHRELDVLLRQSPHVDERRLRGARDRALPLRVDVRGGVSRPRISPVSRGLRRVGRRRRTAPACSRRAARASASTRSASRSRRAIFPSALARGAHGLGNDPGVHDVHGVPSAHRAHRSPDPDDDLPADHEAGAASLRVLPRARATRPPRGIAITQKVVARRAQARLDARRRRDVRRRRTSCTRFASSSMAFDGHGDPRASRRRCASSPASSGSTVHEVRRASTTSAAPPTTGSRKSFRAR